MKAETFESCALVQKRGMALWPSRHGLRGAIRIIPPRVAKRRAPGDNLCLEKAPHSDTLASTSRNPFRRGVMVLVTLGNPREKFWGTILSLSPEGLSLCGVELASFDDFVSLVKDGEPFSPGVVFLPMHRLERMELDLPDGSIPSLSQRFASKTGLDPVAVLLRHSAVNPQAAGEPQ